ncbi:uncharacterized protein LOC141594263 [Silene latifolia]|uniref:uncharacterized protein LOC141594263 n=1 Tax=Silene latifolia TaxID=37657 RepID=UPI003D7750E7
MKTTTCDQLQQKRTSKGKQKIPITRIVNKNSRQVTFTKRRLGLFSKCSQLCSMFPGTQFAAIAFSVGGKPFSDGYPSVDNVVERFLNDTQKDGNFRNDVGDGNNWWETPIDDMNLEDLEKFKTAIERLKKEVVSRVDEIGCSNELECVTNDANFDTQMSDNWMFSDNCREITESIDLGSINTDVGNLFDVIKSVNLGCNDVTYTVSPEFSDNCSELLLESIDFESVDASLGAHASDYSSWMEDSIVPELFPEYLPEDSYLLGSLSCC